MSEDICQEAMDASKKILRDRYLPVLFLMDCSGSTAGTPIRGINEAINQFLTSVSGDPIASHCVDVCVMSFNEAPSVVRDWRPITEADPVCLDAGGGTDIPAALKAGIDKLQERICLYEEQGKKHFCPMLVMLTDGYGGDCTEISRTISDLVSEKKLSFWTLGVKGYDKESLAMLTKGKNVFELLDVAGYDFTEFFDLIASIVKSLADESPASGAAKDDRREKISSCLCVPDFSAWLSFPEFL